MEEEAPAGFGDRVVWVVGEGGQGRSWGPGKAQHRAKGGAALGLV